MGAKYLLDTNTIIDFSERLLPENGHVLVAGILNSGAQISVITKIELLGFHGVNTAIKEFVSSAKVIGLGEKVIDETIAIRSKRKIKLPDAIIAATSIANRLTLVTHNTVDFKKFPELNVIDPHLIN